MENGDSLLFNSWWVWGMVQLGKTNRIINGSLILPFPNHPNQFIIMYETLDGYPPYERPLGAYYAIVDLNMNNGNGKVIEKDIRIFQDTLAPGTIQAVKHGNGKDWWILVPENETNCSYIMKLDETGVSLKHKACMGDMMEEWYPVGGQSVFSPNGKWYAKVNDKEQLNLYEFDRCNGEFITYQKLTVSDEWWFGAYRDPALGVSFSPNSRYIYVSCGKDLIQMDVESTDIQGSLAILDTLPISNSFNYFGPSCLAPNEKIYISTGNEYMHVIENPDTAANYSHISLFSVQLMYPLDFAIPNFANYNLGALPDPCPTVSVEEPLEAGIKVYPNPAGSVVNVEIKARGVFGVIDLQGREILSRVLTEEKTAISVGGLVEGVYIYRIKTDKGAYYGKLVIQR
ncbi:MAG: T9SS type A sorting domain-containing protein [Bacteroidia bacterium]|nr:T9SS type A sorting domain-containing protein [Bacteroidia bacterium]